MLANKRSIFMTQLPESVRRQLAEAPDLAGRFSAKRSFAEHSSADMLAAFAENRLDRQERAELLEHLSICADCRQIMWHVLPELQAQPDMTQAVPVRSASAHASWFHSPALRLSAVAACVIVVGSAVMLLHNMQRKPMAAEQRPAVFEKTMQPNAAPPSEAANRQPVPGSAAVAVMLQPSRPDQTDHTPQTVANVPARAQAQPAMNVPMHANAFTGTTATNVNAEIAGKIFPRWILTSDGLLQRSLDAGKSWQPIAIPGNSSTLHAIAAHGPHVWVGGAAGVLYHSSDAGKDWLQVKPNVGGQTLADDVIGIEFSSIQAGRLITNRQETWITADGGNTWQKK